MILGIKEFMEKTQKRGKETPNFDGRPYIMEESLEETYLKDMIHTDGTGVSIISTITKSNTKCISKLNEIINLSEHPRMAWIKNS